MGKSTWFCVVCIFFPVILLGVLVFVIDLKMLQNYELKSNETPDKGHARLYKSFWRFLWVSCLFAKFFLVFLMVSSTTFEQCLNMIMILYMCTILPCKQRILILFIFLLFSQLSLLLSWNKTGSLLAKHRFIELFMNFQHLEALYNYNAPKAVSSEWIVLPKVQMSLQWVSAGFV